MDEVQSYEFEPMVKFVLCIYFAKYNGRGEGLQGVFLIKTNLLFSFQESLERVKMGGLHDSPPPKKFLKRTHTHTQN